MNPKWEDLYYEFGGRDFEAGIDIGFLKEKYLDGSALRWSRLRGNDKIKKQAPGSSKGENNTGGNQ